MSITNDIQKLEVGNWVELYVLDASDLGAGTLRFHGYQQQASIFWQGQEYVPWPIQAEGFELTPGSTPMPKVTVGNVGGSITSLCLAFQDLVGAKVIRKRTLGKYLDAANFPGGNPTADPDECLPDDTWFIERKAVETSQAVQFELSSGLDIGGALLPARQIIANVCPWAYRSAECGYTGGPVAKEDDTATSDPTLDVCGHRLTSCKLRHGATKPLPFGGCPAAGLIR